MTPLDRRRVRRAGVLIGAVGASLVITATFTDSKATVAVGLSLVVLAHVLFFASDWWRVRG